MRPFGKVPKNKSVRAEPRADNIILISGLGVGALFRNNKRSCSVPLSCFSRRLFSGKSRKGKKPEIEIELITEPSNAQQSMSFVGTHEYLAPEIIKGEGHGSAVDWWTLGVFTFELLFGRTPFKGSGKRATLFNVVGQALRFPESPVVSFEARDLIMGLLVKEPELRLGYIKGANEIKSHRFFEGVNWALVRCASPPEIPEPIKIEPQVAAGAVTGEFAAQICSDDYLDFDFF